MEIIPNSIKYGCSAMSSFSRNRFKIAPAGSTEAREGGQTVFTLPENSVLDLQSFKIHGRVETFSDATQSTAGPNVNIVRCKIPNGAHSLIHGLEISIGGVQVMNISNDYGTLHHIRRLLETPLDRDQTSDFLSHPHIDGNPTLDSDCIVWSDFLGLLGKESGTRFLSTGITGSITIKIVWAPPSVLTVKEAGDNHGDPLTAPEGVNNAVRAAEKGFRVHELYCTCDSVQLDVNYEQMLLERLKNDDYLSVSFVNRYVFQQHGTTSQAHNVRMNVSASSVESAVAVFRNQEYQLAGKAGKTLAGVNTANSRCSLHNFFDSFNTNATAAKPQGDLLYQWTVNGISYPQYLADVTNAAYDLNYMCDRVSTESRGGLVHSLAHFNNGAAIFPLVLNFPGLSKQVKSGLNTRGGPCQIEFNVQGQTKITGGVQVSTLVCVNTVAELRISGNRQIQVVT